MSSFWDPQSGNPYGIIDLKLVHFWSKTAKTWSLRQNTNKHMHDPPAVAQAESSPNLLQTDKQTTDNYFWNAVQRKWRFAQLHPQGKGGPFRSFCVEDVWSTSIWCGSCVWSEKIWDLFVFTLCIWTHLWKIMIFGSYILRKRFFYFFFQKTWCGHDYKVSNHVLDFRLFTSWNFA